MARRRRNRRPSAQDQFYQSEGARNAEAHSWAQENRARQEEERRRGEEEAEEERGRRAQEADDEAQRRYEEDMRLEEEERREKSLRNRSKKAAGVGARGAWKGAKFGAGLMSGIATGSSRLGTKALEKTKGGGLLGLAGGLWLFDFIFGINGIDFNLISSQGADIIPRILGSTFFIGIMIMYYIFRGLPRNPKEFAIPVIFFFLIVLVFSVTKLNPWVFVHIAFALGVFMTLLKGFERSTEIGSQHVVFLLVVFWDLFAFPGLGALIPTDSGIEGLEVVDILSNKLLFPVWVFYFFTFMEDGPGKRKALGTMLLIYLGLFGFQAWNVYGDYVVESTDQQRQDVLDAPQKVIDTYLNLIKSWFTSQIQYAITGKVEENEYEPLGVYLNNIQSASPKYYMEKRDSGNRFEEVIVFGTVSGRTLDDPINVRVGCFVDKSGVIEEAELSDPAGKFTVFSFEEQDFACTFTEEQLNDDDNDNDILKVGSNTVKAFADFNFETLAYQKVFFIDRERLRAMSREGLDVFDEFGIDDKEPVSVYTNGPVAIEMGTSSPLIGVSESFSASPRFSLALRNRAGWEGRITGLRELVLLLPEGVDLATREVKDDKGEEHTIRDCNVQFEPYNEGKCQAACNEFVLTECYDVCSGYGVGSSERDRCEDSCIAENTQCVQQCGFLFNEDDQEYTGYALTESALTEFDNRVLDTDIIEKFESFNCKLDTERNEVLGGTPLTTKFFRVKARYDYSLESPVVIKIVEAPLAEGEESSVCDDDREACLNDDAVCPDQTLGDEGKGWGGELFLHESTFGTGLCSGDDVGEYYLSNQYSQEVLDRGENLVDPGTIFASCNDETDCVGTTGGVFICYDQGPSSGNKELCSENKWYACRSDVDLCDSIDVDGTSYYCDGSEWITSPLELCERIQ
jgi:hypothetical protein